MGRGVGNAPSHRSSGSHHGRASRGVSSVPGRGNAPYHGYVPHFGRYVRPSYYGGRIYGGALSSGSPMTATGVLLVVVFLAAVLIMQLFPGNAEIAKSTKNRERLEAELCQEYAEWINDEANWIFDERTVMAGLREFYEKTGVQPYLWVTKSLGDGIPVTNETMREAGNRLYDSLFADEGHLVVMMVEPTAGDYYTTYVAGSAAKHVIDAEAGEILLDCMDYYYQDRSLSDEEFFSQSFSEAAKRIMKGPSRWLYVTGILVLAVGAAIVIMNRKITLERARREILETPIDRTENELEKKYKEELR